MTWSAYWKAIRHWWIVIVASVCAGGVVMWLATPQDIDQSRQIASYTATATLIKSTKTPKPDPSATASTEPIEPASATLSRIALFVQNGAIPVRAAEALGWTGEPAALASTISVETDDQAGALRISATASDGQVAADRANTFAAETVRYFKNRPEMGWASLSILQKATPLPNTPTGGLALPPTRIGRTALAAGIGLLVGLILALILEFIFARLRTREDVSTVIRIPVVAEVPKLSGAERRRKRLMAREAPLSVYADAYRAARSAVVHVPSGRDDAAEPNGSNPMGSLPHSLPTSGPARVVLVTSAYASEGKTTSAANLAASFAETGQRVLVLDADLRDPDLHEQFDVPQGSGISDFVIDPAGVGLEGIVRPTNVPGVRMITAGTALDHPEALSSRLGQLLRQVRQLADIVIVDTSPMLAASDVFDVLPLVDTVVLVVRSGRLTEAAGTRVSELLGRFRVAITGAILVAAPRRAAGSYGKGYGTKGKRSKKNPAPAPVPATPTVAEEHDPWVVARDEVSVEMPSSATTGSSDNPLGTPRRANPPAS